MRLPKHKKTKKNHSPYVRLHLNFVVDMKNPNSPAVSNPEMWQLEEDMQNCIDKHFDNTFFVKTEDKRGFVHSEWVKKVRVDIEYERLNNKNKPYWCGFIRRLFIKFRSSKIVHVEQ